MPLRAIRLSGHTAVRLWAREFGQLPANHVYFENRSFSSSGSRRSLIQRRAATKGSRFKIAAQGRSDRTPWDGPGGMLVHGWSGCYGVPGRRSRSGWRSRPGREGGHKHLRGRRLVAPRPMRALGVVMASPAFDHNSGLLEGVEDLAIQQLVPQPTSVTPIARIASATGVPCATRTSTWRRLATISSGVCRFFGIVILLRLPSHPSGWTTPKGADHGPMLADCLDQDLGGVCCADRAVGIW